MSKPGRPPVFVADKQQIFLRLVATGIPARTAARHVGVSYSTVREKARISCAFGAAYDKAKSEALANLLDSVHTAGGRSWRAAAWLLERLRPEEFGRRQPLPPPAPTRNRRQDITLYNLTHPNDDVVNAFFDILGMTPAVWETVEARFQDLAAFREEERKRNEEYVRWAKRRGLHDQNDDPAAQHNIIDQPSPESNHDTPANGSATTANNSPAT